MSRIGKQPVTIPEKVSANLAGLVLSVKGPKGTLTRSIRPEITVDIGPKEITLSRGTEEKKVRAYHGLERALIANMVQGVTTGFSKELSLVGVGYRAEVKGNIVNLSLGHSHPIDFNLPNGITAAVIKDGRDTYIKIDGSDRQLVGQVAADIRSLRPPEPYKGKGVRYRNEVIKMKAGKSGKK